MGWQAGQCLGAAAPTRLPAEVEGVLDAWQVARARDPQTGDITHAALIRVVDRTGRTAYTASGGATVVAELLRGL